MSSLGRPPASYAPPHACSKWVLSRIGAATLRNMPLLRFDATIILFSHHLVGSSLEALPREAVVEAVGRAVRALPGAACVDVERAGGPLPEAMRRRRLLDRLYAAESGIVPDEPEWAELRGRVEAAIARGLAGEEPKASTQPTILSGPPGL